MVLGLLFFCFVHLTLLVTGYVIVNRLKLFRKNQAGLQLIFAYIVSLVFFALLGLVHYSFNVGFRPLVLLGWLVILGTSYLFITNRLYKLVWLQRFPIICFVLTSLMYCLFIGLKFGAPYSYIPDPNPLPNRNYHAANIKVLNIAKTSANDNYIPYRQAQFIINRSDPAKDCFVCEWGVSFFQRTPLMGSVTAGYYLVLKERPPIDYLWSTKTNDHEHTYAQFQIIAAILNGLFIIPAFFLIQLLFDKKTAILSLLLLISSQFFLYNAVFSWPKSLVAFFVLTMWLLILQNHLRETILAGVAAGLAYLTHDLAVLYIAASLLLLLYHRRFRDIFIVGGVMSLFAFPWLVISSVIYKKPSTFILYPLSLHGLPQPGHGHQEVREFLHTLRYSPFDIISIRLDTLFFLMSPYNLIYSSGGQTILRRIWSFGILSIPGSLGVGLVIPTIMGIIQKFKQIDLWILIFVPILMADLIVGWRGSRAIASMHFAQASIVLLTAVSVSFLVKLKNKLWFWLVMAATIAQFVYFILFSYNFRESAWLHDLPSLGSLILMASIIIFSIYAAYQLMRNKAPKWLGV
ncbi:MAG TPA: glycosyltransferase family 39 protein [Candidatus Saccharimonadales bacterium]|nr:glycosyltransferase family 39 protein [Candidatus Saccharimonadales bacterium]